MPNLKIFSIFPVLETERLILRQVIQADQDALYRLYSDPLVMQYRGVPEFSGVEEARKLILGFEKHFQEQSGIRWALALKGKESELLGTAGIRKIVWEHFRGEIGYELSPPFWNRGLMTEALQAITDYAFRSLELHTIEANIAPANQASQRVLEKLGFVKEAHFRENWYYKGWWDSVIFTLHNNTSPVAANSDVNL